MVITRATAHSTGQYLYIVIGKDIVKKTCDVMECLMHFLCSLFDIEYTKPSGY